MLNMEASVDPSELSRWGSMTSRRTSITGQPGNGWRRIGERRGEEVANLVHSRAWAKLFYCFYYLFILIFGIQHFMKERRPFNLRAPLVLWSFSLTLFSIIAACQIWKQMAFLLLNKGFKQSVCSKSLYIHPVSKLWIYLFALSKLVEMGDTLFIVLWKKKLIFLHWYHYFLTMILSWYSYKIMVIGLGWNAALSLSIHSVVYFYYTVTAMGFREPRPIMMLITASQIVQMAGFVIINIFAFLGRNDKGCQISWPMLLIPFVLYTTLLALFYNFFRETYLRSAQKSKWN